MSFFIASPAHYERLLGNDGISLKELAASLGEHDESAFVDDQGRLCVRVRERPPDYDREDISGRDLTALFDSYGIADRDLEVLRGRMIVEGAWSPEDVLIEQGRLVVYGDPDLKPFTPEEQDRFERRYQAVLGALREVDPEATAASADQAYESLAHAIHIRMANGDSVTADLIRGALLRYLGRASAADADRITALINEALG